MNAQTLFLIMNDLLQSTLAIGLTLYLVDANDLTLTYTISPFVVISLIIRIIYLKLKKSHPYLNILAVAIYFSKIILVWIAEQRSPSILKLQLTMDILIFLNQKNQIQNINIIVWMISVLVTINILKFEGNFEQYLWKLVCEILIISLDIIISLKMCKKQIDAQQKPQPQPPQVDNQRRQHNLSVLLPIQEIDKQFSSYEQVNQYSSQRNQINYLFQNQYLILNENYTIKSSAIELSQFLVNKNVQDNCLLLFLSIPVIYWNNSQEQRTTIMEYIENNRQQLHYCQAFSVLKNNFFDFQGLIFSLSKHNCQTDTEYLIHFFQAPYEQDSEEQYNRQLLEVCKSLSHELGTNLNSIQTFSDMGMCDDTVPQPIKQKYFKPILINSEQLTFIISNLRDFQLLTLKQFNIKIEKFDLIEEMNKVDALFNDAFSNKNLEFIRDFRGGSTSFFNDKQRFLQVYFQLLQNAVKFTQDGQIKVIIEKKQKNCQITIIDTGIGLAEDEQENLKLLLELNVSLKISQNSVGSGLGLRIANNLVNKMNGNTSNIQHRPQKKGSIFSFNLRNYQQKYTKSVTFNILTVNMESESNKYQKRITNMSSIKQLNAEFYIESSISLKSKRSYVQQNFSQFSELPTFKKEPSSSQIDFDSMVLEDKLNPPNFSPKFKDGITQFSIKSKCCSRVLVVDDEFFNIQCIKVIMESQYQAICSTAYNGKEAISLIQEKLRNPCKICQNNSFQIIFLDINMPIMDGFETVKQIKELQHQGVISKNWCIANTGFCDLQTKMQSYDAGMDFYLTKPLDRKLLNEIIITLFPK